MGREKKGASRPKSDQHIKQRTLRPGPGKTGTRGGDYFLQEGENSGHLQPQRERKGRVREDGCEEDASGRVTRATRRVKEEAIAHLQNGKGSEQLRIWVKKMAF